jgi:RNA polymerase sigma factor (sigma-70 family)
MDEHAPDDRTLVTRIAQNSSDNAPMAAFANRWYSQFYLFALRYTGRHDVAEDLAQDALIKVNLTAHTYDPARPVRAWLVTIVRNLCVDWWRKQRPTVALGAADSGGDDDGPPALDLPDREPSAHERAIARERSAAVRACIALLTEAERDVIVLRDLHELTPAETSAVLGIPVGRVGSRLHRARLRLGELLARECPNLFPPREL